VTPTITRTITVTATPVVDENAVVFIYNTSGILVRELHGGIKDGSTGGLAFTEQPFRADGQRTVGVSADGVLFRWDGKGADGYLVATGDYYIKVRTNGADGSTTVREGTLTVIRSGPALLPTDLVMFPNPASDVVWLDASHLASGVKVKVRIYNLAGENVRDIQLEGGLSGRVAWDLTTPSGQRVAGGIYLATWEAEQGGRRERRVFKLAILKR
jgi:hypothetical protein